MQDGAAVAKTDDRQFVYGYLGEFLDDSLSGEEKTRFERALDDLDLDDLPIQYRKARGQFQLALARQAISEQQRAELHALVEDDATRANHEAMQIEDMTRTQMFGHAFRLLVIVAIIGGLFYAVFRFITPPPRAQFDPLETLMYESTVLSEEGAARLDFPTSNLEEMGSFFARIPALEFEAPRLSKLAPGWKAEGASVIDYDVAKILVGHFIAPKDNEDLFVYFYRGSLSDLPRSDLGAIGEFSYQAYSSDQFNMVAWQVSEGVSGLLVSRLGAEVMADFAKNLIAE